MGEMRMNHNAALVKIADENSENILKIINSLEDVYGFKNAFSDYKGKIGRTQLSKLLNAIRSANSVEEIKLFIKYQESRKIGWDQKCDEKSLAETLLDKINEVMELSEKQDFAKYGLELREVKLKMAEKFFGYLYWQGTVYAKENKPEKNGGRR